MERPAPDRNVALELVRVTESAAMGAARWIGRGEKESADQAAVDGMRAMLVVEAVEVVRDLDRVDRDPLRRAVLRRLAHDRGKLGQPFYERPLLRRQRAGD